MPQDNEKLLGNNAASTPKIAKKLNSKSKSDNQNIEEHSIEEGKTAESKGLKSDKAKRISNASVKSNDHDNENNEDAEKKELSELVESLRNDIKHQAHRSEILNECILGAEQQIRAFEILEMFKYEKNWVLRRLLSLSALYYRDPEDTDSDNEDSDDDSSDESTSKSSNNNADNGSEDGVQAKRARLE